MNDDRDLPEEVYGPEQLVLSDLVNRVLDKGVVISSQITISIADVDLIHVDLRLLISAVAALEDRAAARAKRAKLSLRSRSEP